MSITCKITVSDIERKRLGAAGDARVDLTVIDSKGTVEILVPKHWFPCKRAGFNKWRLARTLSTGVTIYQSEKE